MNSTKLLGLLSLVVIGLVGPVSAYVDPGWCNVGPCNPGGGFQVQSIPSVPGFDFLPPEWFAPTSLDAAPESAAHWINNVLPYEKHKYADKYLVIPTMGMVVPIVDIEYGTDDYWNMRYGGDIEINDYLKNGVVHFPHSGYPGAPGNMFIFGHSNGLLSWDGEFNAVFAKIMGLEVGIDQVWIFDKQSNGKFELFKYNVVRSYETTPSDVNVMLWDGQGSDLTLSACTNKLDGRWIIKAELVDEWEDLDIYLRDRIDIAIKKMSWMPLQQRSATIARFFKLLENAKNEGLISNAEVELIVEYIQRQLAAIFPDNLY